MDINLIQTKPNEYAYLNDVNLTVVETNSDALCPPDSTIEEILENENKLVELNKTLNIVMRQLKENKSDIILGEVSDITLTAAIAFMFFVLSSNVSIPGCVLITLFTYLPLKGMHLGISGTRVSKYKILKKLKKDIQNHKKRIEDLSKTTEELKKEIDYKVVAQIPIEEYKRRFRIIEFERNNKLPNTKYYLNNNENSLEKIFKIGQKRI